ncbi:MAG: DinB family protein [Chitinophagales bacterium]
MEKQLNILEATRKNILGTVKGLTLEELNKTPKGFNNNLIWNLGHVLVTQQLLCYGLSGVPMKADNEIIAKYRKGTKPTDFVGEEEYSFIKLRLEQTIEEIKLDLSAGLFKEFKTYPTSYSVTLDSIEDAVVFNNVHEAMHLGYMMALKHAL